MMTTDTPLILPRRNFLIKALGFTAAGATVTIPIITQDDALKRIDHHQMELEKAWREYYGATTRTFISRDSGPGDIGFDEEKRRPYLKLQHFMLLSGGDWIDT